ncbi:hypothetical protein OGAPHI_006321 [Ogataea philodendri]|uniref:Partial AB-hydrolase lipase domain-containing protein n=1 Tax=Ogataea philodendri TaxID=1378263 RepID=A0A9P8T0S6_9ASCO|nr:uncharacterized protein OGAPHI_006321 [Ogataea philodendri]KAH3661474.1 hypothetical protein OGAPHI_006321 [Ogataea philodendri]
MACALVSHFYRVHVKRDHVYKPSPKRAYPVDNPQRLTKLRYYVQLMGLELYEYRIVTKDGFVISLQRMVDPNTAPTGPPILLLHGLLQSSGSFVTSGYKSLSYLLIRNGYDVWLGNNRCGFDPQHTFLSSNDPEMWDWDLTEMAKYDLTAMVDEILHITKKEKVSLIGHSQGTAQMAMFLSGEFEIGYEDKIDKCIMLAPAIFGGSLLNSKIFIQFIKLLPNSVYDAFFGLNSFMPIMMKLRNIIVGSPAFGFLSYAMFSFLFDWNDHLWDRELRPYHFIFSPVYISAKLMKWWLSKHHGQGFQMGESIFKREREWFSYKTPPMYLVIGEKDKLVDGNLLVRHLELNEPAMRGRFGYQKVKHYSHLDVLWSDDLIEVVGENILNFLATM